jgi:hypothetical protein
MKNPKISLLVIPVLLLLFLAGCKTNESNEPPLETYTLATVTTTQPSTVTASSVILGGDVTADGNMKVTEKGIVYATNQNPSTADNKVPNGTGTGNFSSNITGLPAATTYYVRAYAINIIGTAYGSQVTFTTGLVLSLPTVTTSPATTITGTSAVLGGNVTSDGNAPVTEKGVVYATTQTPTTANTKVVNGTGPGNFVSNVTGLTSGTTYYVRAYAINSQGTAYGTQESFVAILTNPATVTTTPPINITASGATLGGNITSDGNAAVTERGVCYGTSPNPTTSNTKVNNGAGIGSFTTIITGLTNGSVYYVRAYAINSQGTSYGSQEKFTAITTLTATVTTTAVTGLTTTGATLGGNVTNDGNAAVTERGVCYSTTQNPTITNTKVTNGAGVGSFISIISGLTSGTTYFVRAYAINSQGTAYGIQETFTVLATLVATVTTTPATNITTPGATLGGNVTSDGNSAVNERGVCYSTSPNPTTASTKVIGGIGTGSFTTTITGLKSGTTYYVRAYAINSIGTAYGVQEQFTALSTLVATLTTTAPYGVSATGATVGGNVTSDGNSTVTERGICYGTNAAPTTADTKMPNGAGTGSFTSPLTGLKSGTTYYVRAYAINSIGTSYGNEVQFSTNIVLSAPTVTTIAASGISSTTATLGGNVTSDGNETVTDRGVCYSTSPNPTTANSKVASGIGTGIFSANASGLTPATVYYVRAYATNYQGTAYGAQLTFTTGLALSLATVTTTAATNINATVATSGGDVTSDGNDPITERGICFSTLQNPTTTDTKISSGTGKGVFTSNLTGLKATTTYYVRAYAINGQGTAYGNQVTFSTTLPLSLPTVTTANVGGITNTGAASGGNVTSEGNAAVTERGIVYYTSANPTTANLKVVSGSGRGTFTASLTGLASGVTYYVKAYAINSVGTAYGNQMTFTTTKPVTLATVTTSPFTNRTSTSVTLGGNVTNGGNVAVTERGIVFSTSQNPTTSDFKVSIGNGTGTYSFNVTGLTSGTTYYVRAYAINSVGTAYGSQITVTMP